MTKVDTFTFEDGKIGILVRTGALDDVNVAEPIDEEKVVVKVVAEAVVERVDDDSFADLFKFTTTATTIPMMDATTSATTSPTITSFFFFE